MKNLEYPGYPIADWRIAVSKRFNVPEIDELYSKYVLPILKDEGIILQCSSSPENLESIDYWVNKYSTILELSDIHIFIDEQRSANMEFEYRQSKIIAGGAYSSLLFNLGMSPPLRLLALSDQIPLIKPFVICIREKTLIDTFSRFRNKSVIGISSVVSINNFETRLRKKIHKAKIKRLRRLRIIHKYLQPLINKINISDEDLYESLKMMTVYARNMSQGATLKTISEKISAESFYYENNRIILKNSPFFHLQTINRRRKWLINIYKGKVDNSLSFNDIREMMTKEAQSVLLQIFIFGSIDYAESKNSTEFDELFMNDEFDEIFMNEMEQELKEIPLLNFVIKFFGSLNGWKKAINTWIIYKRVGHHIQDEHI